MPQRKASMKHLITAYPWFIARKIATEAIEFSEKSTKYFDAFDYKSCEMEPQPGDDAIPSCHILSVSKFEVRAPP